MSPSSTTYTPAYVGLAVAGVALISVPTHMLEYRESGVLRRFRASSVKKSVVLGSQMLVSFAIATVGAGLLLAAAFMFTDVSAPQSPWGVLEAYLLSATTMVGLGLVLATVLPTARAAQAVGFLLWFVFMFLSGAGPPPEVLPDSLRTIGDWTPFTPLVELLQEPWLTGQWPAQQSLIAAALLLVGIGVAWRAYAWE